MADKRVGDRADHARGTGAKPSVQLVFEKDDPRFVVHAVIGVNGNDSARFDKCADPLVERPVKRIRFGIARCVAVLNVIG